MAGYLSKGTTAFTSDVSIAGNLVVAGTQTFTGAATFTGAISTPSAISGGAITGTTVTGTSTFSGAAAKFTTLTLNGQLALTLVSASSTTIVATTALKNRSTNTNFTDNLVLSGDLVEVGPSNLSNGLTLQAFSSANSTITFSYSNSSGADAAQVAINCRYMVWRF